MNEVALREIVVIWRRDALESLSACGRVSPSAGQTLRAYAIALRECADVLEQALGEVGEFETQISRRLITKEPAASSNRQRAAA